MSLTTKIATILTALILSLTAIGATVQNLWFGRIFQSIEREEAGQELIRVRRALDAEVNSCAQSAHRLATWTPSHRFALEPESPWGRVFIEENLSPSALAGEQLDLLYFCRLNGEVIGGTILDPATGQRTVLREFPKDKLAPHHQSIAWAATQAERDMGHSSGIMATERGPLLVATEPIAPEGERTQGYVIAGRFLIGDLSKRISDSTQVNFDAWLIEGDRSHLPAEVAERVDDVTGSPVPILMPSTDGERLSVLATYDDIRRQPIILLRADVERTITRAGDAALKSGGLTDATLGLAILLGLLFTLNVVVLRPIKALTDHAVRTGQSENFRAKFGLDRDDEIGTLSDAFDEMMTKLEQARSALVETARTAGMSEIATGILHNVGNVLNSVNISASLVSQRVEGLCIDDLQRLAEVITDHKDDLASFLSNDPRGQHIQPFLSALVVELSEEQRSIRTEVDSLTNGIDHICELIKSQQSLAKGTKLIEPTDLSERLDEALRITQRVHGVDGELVVVRRFDEISELSLDKHKLLEILVNLVQNARQAMARCDGPRELTLELRRIADGKVLLAVGDSGIGIPEEDLERVFNMGFTTRDDGHGFGLHSSANAAVEMGGRLYAVSDGPGRGAKFCLELPMTEAIPASLLHAQGNGEEATFGGAA